MADHTSRTSSIYSAQNDRRTSVRSNQRSAWHSQVPLKGLTKRAMRMETDLRNPQPFETLPPLQQPASGLRAFICASISRGVAKQPEEPLKLHSLRQALRLSPFFHDKPLVREAGALRLSTKPMQAPRIPVCRPVARISSTSKNIAALSIGYMILSPGKT